MSEKKPSLKARIARVVRNRMLSGLLVVVPVGFTILVLKMLYGWTSGFLDGAIRPLVEEHFPELIDYLPVISIVALILLVYLVGGIAAMVAGKRLISMVEAVVLRIPLVKSIYSAAKQVMEAVTLSERGAFKAVVMMEFPRPGIRSIGFLTGQIKDVEGRQMYKIFLPTAPNPTTGFLEIVSPEQVQFLDMTVEDAFKMLLSGGIIAPDQIKYRSVGSLETSQPVEGDDPATADPTVPKTEDSAGQSSPNSDIA